MRVNQEFQRNEVVDESGLGHCRSRDRRPHRCYLNNQAVTGFDRMAAVLGFRAVVAVPPRHKWPTRVVVKLVGSKGIGTKPLVDLGRGRGIRTTLTRANPKASRTVLGNVSRIGQTTARKEDNRQQGVASTHPIRRLDLPKLTKCYTIPSMIGWRMTMKIVKPHGFPLIDSRRPLDFGLNSSQPFVDLDSSLQAVLGHQASLPFHSLDIASWLNWRTDIFDFS